MTKVAYLLGGLERGGTETLLLDTLRRVRRTDWPCLLVYRKPGALLAAFRQTDVPMQQLFPRHRLDVAYLLRLRRLLVGEGIRVVHAQLPLDAFLAYWACLGTGIRLVLSVHGYDFGYNRLARLLLRFILPRTDRNLFVSQYLASHYRTGYDLRPRQHRQHVVYNGVDFRKFGPAPAQSVRRELGIPPGVLLLVCVGNFVAVRDQLTICRFLNRLRNEGIDFRFLFVGSRNPADPIHYDQCVAYCTEHGLMDQVRFLGSRHDVPALLTEADAFVYASHHDTFGIAVVEAMAAGIPVFVNDWPVMREITDNGTWATLYRTQDIDDLTRRFLDFLRRRPVYRAQAVRNAERVRNRFSIEQHFEELKRHYTAVAQAL